MPCLPQDDFELKSILDDYVLIPFRGAAYLPDVTSDIHDLIARRVRALRTTQGLTLETLADRAGVPIETLSRVERRRIAPSIRSLERIARGLGVPLVALLSDEPVPAVSAEGIPPEVRGIALRLAGQPSGTLRKIARIVDVLVADDAE